MKQYADKIVRTLKEAPANDHQSIWDVFVNDKEIRLGCGLSEINMKLFDEVFQNDINGMTKERVVDLWESTGDCYIFEESSPFRDENSVYDGDIVVDIKEELIPLIILDICSYQDRHTS